MKELINKGQANNNEQNEDKNKKKLACLICLKKYKTQRYLNKHTEMEHPNSGTEKIFRRKYQITSKYLSSNTKKAQDKQIEESPQMFLKAFQMVLGKHQNSKYSFDQLTTFIPEALNIFQTKEMCINKIFGQIVQFLFNKVPLQSLQQLLVLLFLWTQCLNRRSNKYTNKKQNNECYCSYADGEFILEPANYLFADIFQKYSPEYLSRLQNILIFNKEMVGINLCRLIFIISHWMNYKNYTQYTIEYNNDS